MKITVERQPKCTGKDAWKATLEIDSRGYRVEILGNGETSADARKMLANKFSEMQRAVTELLSEK